MSHLDPRLPESADRGEQQEIFQELLRKYPESEAEEALRQVLATRAEPASG